MFTDSPYFGNVAGHRHLLIVGARKNCSKHVTLELEGGKTMLVDDNHPVVQISSRPVRTR